MSLIFQFFQKKYRRFRLFLRLFVFKNDSETDRWFWEYGDDTLRLNYPLDGNSLVLDVHPWIEDAENRRQNIRATLSKTHRLTYDFPFVWENWQRMEP